MVVSIEGLWAVGKTTLTDRVRRSGIEITIFEGYYIENSSKYFDEATDFYDNQRHYIKQKIHQMDLLDKDKDYLIVRGPEGIEMYSLLYPQIYGYKWNPEIELKDELNELRKRRSDVVLFLDASKETLVERNRHDDVKKRKHFIQKMNAWYEKYKEGFMKYDNTIILDTTKLSKEDVFEYVVALFDKK